MAKAMFVIKGREYFPQMGLMQISATAKQAGHETLAGILSKEDVLDKIRREKPDVVAYTGSTGEHKSYFEFNQQVKRLFPEVKTMMGGPHATFFPAKTLEEGQLDAVCISEGDFAFPEFLDRIDRNESFSDLENIMTDPNVMPKLRPLIQDLDSLPFPDRALFYEIGESGDNPIKHFFVSRGCPYRCSYCFNGTLQKMHPGEKYVRKRSVDNVLKEILEAREKWPMQYIKFYDDVFTLRADDWLKEFAEKYSAQIGLPFFSLVRADNVNEEMVDLLKKAGCHAVSMSVESANSRLRKEILNRRMTDEQLRRGYKLFGDKGITIQSNNILGLPTSTIDDDIATVDFNIECGPKQGAVVMAEFGTAHPYPGTALGDFCEEHGFYDKSKGFKDMHASYHDESPLNCFTEQEKRMQKNLTMLGTVAVRFPSTRNLIMNHLIKMKTNPLFFAAFYLTKTTGYMKHIHPLNYTLKDYLRVIPQSLALDWFKRMRKK
jgi:radical SAM superfamily enzyme YgiQ (UPF0313 family)